jgi:LL-diaminopimelate aminotransferase
MRETLASIPPYVFYELEDRRNLHRARGRKLLDVGIGSPDGPIPDVVVEAMVRAASARPLSGYPNFRMDAAYAQAVAGYCSRRFGVTVDPGRQLHALAGSKEGIAELILSHVNPGDAVLVPAIHYPVYSRATCMAGATPVLVPYHADGTLDLEGIPAEALARARVLIINYPTNPTTAAVELPELARLVAFAQAHGLLLISDLAYSELAYDGYIVPSVLQVPGAEAVAVETHSCSKSFNMAGVRAAFVVGNPQAIETLDRYRTNIGYGVSTLAQQAAAAAFAHAEGIVPPIVAEYQRRRDALVEAFCSGGWAVTPPRATMYLWLDVPSGYADWGWVDALLEGPGVVVTPGIAFGEAGRGKFRISLVQPTDQLVAAAAGMMTVAASGPVRH